MIRNFTSGWPAMKRWEKDAFVEHYGSRVIRTGSESSIVHSGGVAEYDITLSDIVESMKPGASNSFVFDTTILSVIPELTADFFIPSIFQDWDNEENETKRLLWHMLSLGPTNSGKRCF